MKKVIYLDNAATTKVRPEVVEAMLPFYTEYYGNPSAVYEFSTPCKEALAKARETVANALGAKDNEIYFTNGGSESDNWALIATAEAYASKGKHIITTKIEHHAILHTCEYLEKRGYEITYLPVDEYGSVSIDELKKAIRPDTILISVMFANNEIGTIEPIREIGEVAKEIRIVSGRTAFFNASTLTVPFSSTGRYVTSYPSFSRYWPVWRTAWCSICVVIMCFPLEA